MSGETIVSAPIDPALDPKRKLRAACNNCHQSKVRCTGGSPCDRCADLEFSCEYSYSARIGKPKGSKSKRTLERLRDQHQQHQQKRHQQEQHRHAPQGRRDLQEHSQPRRPCASAGQPSDHGSPTSASPSPSLSGEPTLLASTSPRESTLGIMLDEMLDKSMCDLDGGQAISSPTPQNTRHGFDCPDASGRGGPDPWALDNFDDTELHAMAEANFPLMEPPFGPPPPFDTGLNGNQSNTLVGSSAPSVASNEMDCLQATCRASSKPPHTHGPVSAAAGGGPGPSPRRRSSGCACFELLDKTLVHLHEFERRHAPIQVDVLLISAMPSLGCCKNVLDCASCWPDLRIAHFLLLILRTLVQWLFSPLSQAELSPANATTPRLRLGRYDMLSEEAEYAQNFLLSRVVCRYRVVVKALQERLESVACSYTMHSDLAIVEERKMDLDYFRNASEGLLRRLEQFMRLYKSLHGGKRYSVDICGDGMGV